MMTILAKLIMGFSLSLMAAHHLLNTDQDYKPITYVAATPEDPRRKPLGYLAVNATAAIANGTDDGYLPLTI